MAGYTLFAGQLLWEYLGGKEFLTIDKGEVTMMAVIHLFYILIKCHDVVSTMNKKV